MTILWNRDTGIAICGDKQFTITSDVRNELNGRRSLGNPKEVVRAIVKGQWGPPYMPRPFPLGKWRVTGIEKTDVPEFAPIKIKTDAWQMAQVWELDKDGGYSHSTDEYVRDEGYYLHWSQGSKTTLGCGRVGLDTDKEVRALALLIQSELEAGCEVFLEVT